MSSSRGFFVAVVVVVFTNVSGSAPMPADSMPAGSMPAELRESLRASDGARVAELLRKEPTLLGSRDATGATPLVLACWMADVEIVKALLELGADANDVDAEGTSALHRAVHDREKVRLLLARGADGNVRSSIGNTPLLLAARYARCAETLRLLLDGGADVDARNDYGVTPLLVVAASGDLDALRLLLERGADVNAVSTLQPETRIPDPIFGGGLTALGWAAFRGDLEAARVLLDHGAEIDRGGMLGTPLIQATQRGEIEMARFLLDRGASVSRRSGPGGFPALLWAADSERPDPAIVELLLERGASPDSAAGRRLDAFTGVDHSALMIARRRGETPIVRALLAAGAGERPDPLARRRMPEPRAIDGPILPDRLARSIAAATPHLEEAAVVSQRDYALKAGPCVSCHNQHTPLAALGAAHSRGLRRDEERVAEIVGAILGDQTGTRVLFAEPTFHPAPAQTIGFARMALDEEGVGARDLDDDLVHALAAFQTRDGRWENYLPRPPIQTSDVSPTAMAIRVLKSGALPGRRAELLERVARARDWLSKVEPHGIDERVFQLLGLAWAGDSPASLEARANALLAEQHEDGGWAQLPTLASDAYATAQAIHALRSAARVSPSHPALERGVRYLLSVQLDDGTWLVRRRAFPFQPTFRSGFPHGRDAWISTSATSWAVLALAACLDTPVGSVVTPTLARVDLAELAAAKLPPAADRMVDYRADVAPIFAKSCVRCHRGRRAQSGLRLDEPGSLLTGGRSREPAVIPGESARSPLLHLVAGLVEELEMPPLDVRDEHPPLTNEQIRLLRAWIDQGARLPVESEASRESPRETE